MRANPQGPESGTERGRLVSGSEFALDRAVRLFGFDPLEGFQLLDAASLDRGQLRPRLHTVIARVDGPDTAARVKETLLKVYPGDYPATIAEMADGSEGAKVRAVPLRELDGPPSGVPSLVYLKAGLEDGLRRTSFDRLYEIVGILRSPNGCPWDRAQTHQSIRQNFIEETFEALEAIDTGDVAGMREELGDVLLQILLHCRMEEELGTFDVYDVLGELHDKLIFRHPHVFGDAAAGNPDEALSNWEAMKAEEKRRRGDASRTSVLDGIPKDLPALPRAYKLQKKAAKAGFDWPDLAGVFAKIEEELAELKAAAGESPERSREELGDLLFAVVNAARFLRVDPEEALARTNRKFAERFRHIERRLAESGRTFDQTNLDEMESWWSEAKAGESGS